MIHHDLRPCVHLMVLTETSSARSWPSGGVWPRQHRWRRSVLYPEWWSWKHMEIRSWTEEHSLQPAQKQPWLWTRWVPGRKMMNFSLFCFSNSCGCVTEIWVRIVCKIFRLLSCVSSKPVELDDGSIVVNVRNNKNYHCRCRMVVRSLDGGESLPVEELVFHHTLEDPAVAAGALEKEGVLYFTNPANTNSSEHDDISVSPSWSWSTTVLHLIELSLLTHLIRETSKMCSAVVLWEKDLLTNYF